MTDNQTKELEKILDRFMEKSIDSGFGLKVDLDDEYSKAFIALNKLIQSERTKAEQFVIDLAHRPCECGKDHLATPVRSVTGALTSYCQFSRVTLSASTQTSTEGES